MPRFSNRELYIMLITRGLGTEFLQLPSCTNVKDSGGHSQWHGSFPHSLHGHGKSGISGPAPLTASWPHYCSSIEEGKISWDATAKLDLTQRMPPLIISCNCLASEMKGKEERIYLGQPLDAAAANRQCSCSARGDRFSCFMFFFKRSPASKGLRRTKIQPIDPFWIPFMASFAKGLIIYANMLPCFPQRWQALSIWLAFVFGEALQCYLISVVIGRYLFY